MKLMRTNSPEKRVLSKNSSQEPITQKTQKRLNPLRTGWSNRHYNTLVRKQESEKMCDV